MSKGSKRRPQQVDRDTLTCNWDKVFKCEHKWYPDGDGGYVCIKCGVTKQSG